MYVALDIIKLRLDYLIIQSHNKIAKIALDSYTSQNLFVLQCMQSLCESREPVPPVNRCYFTYFQGVGRKFSRGTTVKKAKN